MSCSRPPEAAAEANAAASLFILGLKCVSRSLLHFSDTGGEAVQALKIHSSSSFNLSPWLLQSLATMGLTFTKTQWICVTHTHQSIHKITRLLHQQAPRAYHPTLPWKQMNKDKEMDPPLQEIKGEKKSPLMMHLWMLIVKKCTTKGPTC